MKKITTASALALIVALGCGGNEEEAESAANDLAASLQAAADNAATAAANEAAAANTEAATNAAEAATGANQAGEGLAALGQALGAAVAAGEAGAEGGSNCEQAYSGAQAMMAALTKQLGEGSGQGMPDRDTFLEACNQLPENAQQCMVPAYAMANMETCRAMQNDPEVQRIRALMRPQAAN